MSRHELIRPCRTPAGPGPAFRVRPCRRSPPGRSACCRVLHLSGELDLAATPALLLATGTALEGQPERGERRRGGLVLDLGALTFCDAAGLTGLLRAARLADTAGVPVSVTAPPHTLVRILVLCGLQRSFALHPATTDRVA